MANLPSLPPRADLMDLFRAQPALARALIPFVEYVMRGPSPLSAAEREWLAAYVSALNGCAYCRDSHGAIAQALGGDAGMVDLLLDDIETAPIDERMKPLFKFARALTQNPASVTGAEAAAILDAGWPEAAVLSVTLVVAQFNMMNRLVDGLGLWLDDAQLRNLSAMLGSKGYQAMLGLVVDLDRELARES